jgi:phospholipase C
MQKLFKTLCLGTSALTLAIAPAGAAATTTPIQHVIIIIIGENHTFDNVYGAYQPKAGQSVDNLLSKGIVNADGTPGPHIDKAKQLIGADGPRSAKYLAETPSTGAYATLPQPYTTYALLQPQNVLDTRFPADIQNGVFQITKYVSYLAFTGDPVHRFFQMWQDIDNGKNDKFVWVEETIGTGSNGAPYPAGGFNPKQGAIAMGFYNMNPYKDASGAEHPGDAPVFKALADAYAMSDNYHQAVMGGTGANFQAIVSGDVAFFTDPTALNGSAATPWINQIENPDPATGSNNYYTHDGYSGGSYVNCADSGQPGVASVMRLLHKNDVHNANCEAGHYYLVNNYNMYWNQTSAVTRPLGSTDFTLPPQSLPTIADVMTKKACRGNITAPIAATTRACSPATSTGSPCHIIAIAASATR